MRPAADIVRVGHPISRHSSTALLSRRPCSSTPAWSGFHGKGDQELRSDTAAYSEIRIPRSVSFVDLVQCTGGAVVVKSKLYVL